MRRSRSLDMASAVRSRAPRNMCARRDRRKLIAWNSMKNPGRRREPVETLPSGRRGEEVVRRNGAGVRVRFRTADGRHPLQACALEASARLRARMVDACRRRQGCIERLARSIDHASGRRSSPPSRREAAGSTLRRENGRRRSGAPSPGLGQGSRPRSGSGDRDVRLDADDGACGMSTTGAGVACFDRPAGFPTDPRSQRSCADLERRRWKSS